MAVFFPGMAGIFPNAMGDWAQGLGVPRSGSMGANA
jgi:hypothetical protein